MAELSIEAVIKSGVEEALNKPIVDGKSITEWAAIGMKAPRWISFKDRLPEKDEDVILYGYYVGPSGETYPTTIISDIEEFKGYGCVPLYWMPLPEPPKEEP